MKAESQSLVKIMLAITLSCVAFRATAITRMSNCSRKWLQEKDCQLRERSFRLQVWQDKVLANDGRSRDTVTLPYAGDLVTWRRVRLISFGVRRFIEINLWATPDPQTGIQSRKWLLYEWRKGQLIKDLDVPVQNRKQLAAGQFLYDPATHTQLKVANSKLVWRCGDQHGKF